ncbi:MAG: chemotaxis protein CheW, partial [Pseudomonadota bacterium]
MMSNQLQILKESKYSSHINEENLELVTIRIDGQLFGIPVLTVQDVLRGLKITRIPLAAPEIAGSLNLRGRIVTAIELRSFFDLPVQQDRDLTKVMSVVVEYKNEQKSVNCDYEFATNIKNIEPLNDMETRVPYKIMSFDIEASSSHGDFPVPIKTYKKLATNIIE